MRDEILQAIATNVPEYDAIIRETDDNLRKCLEIVDNLKPRVLWLDELEGKIHKFTVEVGEHSRVATLPNGPVRVKVLGDDDDDLGFRWLWKTGEALRPIMSGDVVEIDQQMQDDIVAGAIKDRPGPDVWAVEENVRKDFRIGRRMIFRAVRQTRTWGMLVLFFEGQDQRRGGYSLQQLQGGGFCTEEPQFEELPLHECPEKYLDEHELVLKELMKDPRIPGRTDNEVDAKVYLQPVLDAMRKHGIVLYRP